MTEIAGFREAHGVGTAGTGFGEDVAGSWGGAEGPTDVGSESIPRDIDLGPSHKMTLNPEQVKALLRNPTVVAAIQQRAQDIADAANSMAEHIGRPDREDPTYRVIMQNRSYSTRARARVFPQNYQAVLDDAKNSTLLKAMLVHPSDPIPSQAAAPTDTPWSPGLVPSAEGELGTKEAGIGEAGEAGAAVAAL